MCVSARVCAARSEMLVILFDVEEAEKKKTSECERMGKKDEERKERFNANIRQEK